MKDMCHATEKSRGEKINEFYDTNSKSCCENKPI